MKASAQSSDTGNPNRGCTKTVTWSRVACASGSGMRMTVGQCHLQHKSCVPDEGETRSGNRVGAAMRSIVRTRPGNVLYGPRNIGVPLAVMTGGRRARPPDPVGDGHLHDPMVLCSFRTGCRNIEMPPARRTQRRICQHLAVMRRLAGRGVQIDLSRSGVRDLPVPVDLQNEKHLATHACLQGLHWIIWWSPMGIPH